MSGIVVYQALLVEVLFFLVVIGFAVHQVLAMKRLKREREEKEAAEKALEEGEKGNGSDQ